jgi:hypothetical protein
MEGFLSSPLIFYPNKGAHPAASEFWPFLHFTRHFASQLLLTTTKQPTGQSQTIGL